MTPYGARKQPYLTLPYNTVPYGTYGAVRKGGRILIWCEYLPYLQGILHVQYLSHIVDLFTPYLDRLQLQHTVLNPESSLIQEFDAFQ